MEEFLDKLNLFEVKKEDLLKLSDFFLVEMEKNLCSTERHITMLDTHIEKTPSGNEKGTFLTLDVGGTNLRVCIVTLCGDRKTKGFSKTFKIKEEKKKGTAIAFFDYVSECIEKSLPDLLKWFDKENKGEEFLNKSSGYFPLSFTFSFPVEQKSVKKGILLNLSKGFTCSGMVGEDVVDLLQNALVKRKLPIQVVCLINDAVGTLMSAAYKRENVIAGVVIGTGTNASYFEKTKKRIINVEWADFGNGMLPRNRFDIILDEGTANKEKHLYEKMISGKYLGELFRLFLIDSSSFFSGEKEIPTIPFSINTEAMSIFFTKKINNEKKAFGIELTQNNKELILKVCEIIYKRSAALIAAGISALYKRVGVKRDESINISIDGSIYSKTIDYSKVVDDFIKIILPEESHQIVITEETDGSNIGGAVVSVIIQKN